VLENVDTSISALADRIMSRRGRFDQFTPVWPEIEARIGLEGRLPAQRAIWRRIGRHAIAASPG
jgi:hypothetical protein